MNLTGAASDVPPERVGISFVEGSTSTLFLSQGGKKYLVDLRTRTVRESDSTQAQAAPANNAAASPSPPAGDVSRGQAVFRRHCATCHGTDGKGIAGAKTPNFTDPKVLAGLTDEQILTTIKNGRPGTMMPAWGGKLSDQEIRDAAAYVRSLGSTGAPAEKQSTRTAQSELQDRIYQPGDDTLFNLPTGRQINEHGLYLNFAHRFAYDPVFSGPARGGALLGLDGFSLSSFGLRYGVSKNLSVSLYRSPTFIGRPIEMLAAYNLLSEEEEAPLNVTARFSLDGEDDFQRSFTENFELILSRSFTHRAQVYVVPTVSVNAHRLFSPNSYTSGAIPRLPGYDTFSTGIGVAFDIRPSVALVAEVIPTLVNAAALGIHRPAYSFGIQKKIWRHAFTLGLTNAPGTVVSQRAGTRAAFLGNPNADEPSGLFIGFNITALVKSKLYGQ